jgi:hypothetical protein
VSFPPRAGGDLLEQHVTEFGKDRRGYGRNQPGFSALSRANDMKIAIIAWGSLIWDPRTLQITGKDWPRNGPIIQLRIFPASRLTAS